MLNHIKNAEQLIDEAISKAVTVHVSEELVPTLEGCIRDITTRPADIQLLHCPPSWDITMLFSTDRELLQNLRSVHTSIKKVVENSVVENLATIELEPLLKEWAQMRKTAERMMDSEGCAAEAPHHASARSIVL